MMSRVLKSKLLKISALTLACFLSFPSAHAKKFPGADAPCISGDQNIDQRLMLKSPAYDKIPSGLKIDQKKVRYVVLNSTQSYLTPRKDDQFNNLAAALKEPYEETAVCRVRGMNGDWWLAVRFADGAFYYVLEKDTVSAAEYYMQNH